MKKIMVLFMLLAGMVLFSAAMSQAVTIRFDRTSLNVIEGNTFTVDLMVSELGNHASPSLGAFDVDILYDISQMTFLSWTLGQDLGDMSPGEALDLSTGDVGGLGFIDIAEISLIVDPLELINRQPDVFSLATLEFRCLRPGSSAIAIDGADTFLYLGDENGNLLDPFTVRGPVMVNQIGQPSQVPEPSTIALLGVGLAGLGFYRRKR